LSEIKSNSRRDLFVRDGNEAPLTPSLIKLAANPEKLRSAMLPDDWRPWIAIPCADGRWIDLVSSSVSARNCGGTDQITPLGGVGTIAKFIFEKKCLKFLEHQIAFAHEQHGVIGVQLITHSFCGATKSDVLKILPESKVVFRSPTKAPVYCYYQTLQIEAEIHRHNLDVVRSWLFNKFSFLAAVEYLHSIKRWLRPFGEYEQAIKKALDESSPPTA